MVSRVSMTHAELGVYLARQIFKAGDDSSDKVQRIAFKGGKYGKTETDLGGFCEAALAGYLQTALDDLATGKAPPSTGSEQ